jgi:hypothetical protein
MVNSDNAALALIDDIVGEIGLTSGIVQVAKYRSQGFQHVRFSGPILSDNHRLEPGGVEIQPDIAKILEVSNG